MMAMDYITAYKTFGVLDVMLIKIDVHCRLYSRFAKLTKTVRYNQLQID